MNDKPLFASILDESPTEVVRPKPLPEGTYLWTVQGRRYDKSTKKGTDYIAFDLAAIQPFDDVPISDLEAAGGLEGKTKEVTFYITEGAVFLLDAFHEACGIDLSTPVSRKQRNEMVLNAQVIGVVKHRIDRNEQTGEDRTFWDIVQTARYGA